MDTANLPPPRGRGSYCQGRECSLDIPCVQKRENNAACVPVNAVLVEVQFLYNDSHGRRFRDSARRDPASLSGLGYTPCIIVILRVLSRLRRLRASVADSQADSI